MIYIPPLEEEVDSTQVEDGGVLKIFACVFIQTPSPVRVLPLIQEGELFTLFLNLPDSNIYERASHLHRRNSEGAMLFDACKAQAPTLSPLSWYIACRRCRAKEYVFLCSLREE